MRTSLGLFACLALLTACTPPLKLESAWLPGARPAQPYSKVLVVAVSDDFNRRRAFENSLANELAAGGTAGIPSTRTMLTTDVVDRESVAALVKAAGAEAVLVTRLAYEAVDVKQKRGREVLKMDNPGAPASAGTSVEEPYFYNVYTYDYSVSAEPPALEIRRDITVTTDLFSAGDGKRIYTIRSNVRITNSERMDQNTDVAVMDKVATELARRLRRDRAVR
ncbi:MAG: hypothetical protein JNK40_02025 [Chromatiales bacterium]|nr:hypothetical protein [Chromatiales bacterium]